MRKVTPGNEELYNELIRKMEKEFEEKIPEQRSSLDMHPDQVRKEIAERYLPQILELTTEITSSD